MKYTWDTDQVGGHAPYCNNPFHSLWYYCTADLDDQGRPIMKSRFYLEDHPEKEKETA